MSFEHSAADEAVIEGLDPYFRWHAFLRLVDSGAASLYDLDKLRAGRDVCYEDRRDD